MELVIELVDEGELTPLLWPLQEGDTVWVRKKVVGHFLLDAERTRHVMACTVTGIAPFLSMIRAHAAALAAGETVPDHRFLVVHGASHGIHDAFSMWTMPRLEKSAPRRAVERSGDLREDVSMV